MMTNVVLLFTKKVRVGKLESEIYVAKVGQLRERESEKSKMSCHVIFASAFTASGETEMSCLPSDIYFCLVGC